MFSRSKLVSIRSLPIEAENVLSFWVIFLSLGALRFKKLEKKLGLDSARLCYLAGWRRSTENKPELVLSLAKTRKVTDSLGVLV